MAPGVSDASAASALTGCAEEGDDWAPAGNGTHKCTRTPAAAAIRLGVFLMRPSVAAGSARALSGGNGEVDVARYRLRPEFVRNLDFKPIIARRERRQRHRLSGLQLVAERHVERRRQRLAVQFLRRGLVEELLRGARRLL